MRLSEIKEFLLKKGFKVSKLNKNSFGKEFKNFYLTLFVSFFIVAVFFIAPNTVNFAKKALTTPDVIINKSKEDFDKTLSAKNKTTNNSKIDQEINSESLFEDINIGFTDIPSDAIRFSAATLEEIYKDKPKYNLKKVRNSKLVNTGYAVDLLPNDLKKIENVKKRKDLFIRIVLPLILQENNRIKLDRKRLFVILNKNNNSKSEKDWLKKKFKQYGVVNNDLSTLKIRMDEIPVSLAIAQAAKETGWGTSRFAIEGNALFGQWTFNGEGIKPASADSDSTHKVMKFKYLKASVRAYQRNINTHSSYREFRRERAIQRDNEEKLNSLELVKYLDKYAETGIEYTKVLKKIIQQNSLTDFDDVKMLPTSLKLKNLI